jgi:hypothetical protein
LTLEIAHKSIQWVYLLQNWVEAQSYWAVLFAKTANAIGLLPEKRDTGNLQLDSMACLLCGVLSALEDGQSADGILPRVRQGGCRSYRGDDVEGANLADRGALGQEAPFPVCCEKGLLVLEEGLAEQRPFQALEDRSRPFYTKNDLVV